MLLTTIDLGAERCNDLLAGSIIPGNRHSGHPTEKFIFQQLLTLEAEEREGQLHREIEPTALGKGYQVLDYCFARIRAARASSFFASSSRPVFV